MSPTNQIQAALSNTIELSSNVKVYIPSTVDVDTPADTGHYVNLVSGSFSRWFGGATAYDALGAWNSATTGKVVYEPVRIVEAYASESDLASHIQDVLSLAGTIRQELSQDAVAIEVNNKLYLV